MKKTVLMLLCVVFLAPVLVAGDRCCEDPEPVKQEIQTVIERVKALNSEDIIELVKQHKTGIIVTGCVLTCLWYAYKNKFFSRSGSTQS